MTPVEAMAVDTGQPEGRVAAAVAFQTDSDSVGATGVAGQHIQMVGNNLIELLLLQQNQALVQQNQALVQQNQTLAQQNQALAQQNQALAQHVESSGRIILAVLILMIIGIIIIIINILHFVYMF